EWIERTKFDYGEGISTICQFEQQIALIKQLLVVRRHLCSGTITAEEIKEINLVLADVIDAGNNLLKLNMNIRDDSGIYANLDESDLENISLWMTCLIIGPIGSTLFSVRGGDDVRQYYANGHALLGELIKEMVDKEQREQTLILQRKETDLVLPSNNYQNNSCSITNTIKNEKIPIKLNIQLFNEFNSLITPSTNIQILRPLKLENEHFCRNELFIWLRDADFHGIARSEKSIEAVVSVVDDEGIFLPEAIEVITPEGSIRESSFRCRVWPSTVRPRFNELIKVLLPDQEAKNLHLQILFYNKSFIDRKSLYSTAGSYSTNSLNPKKENNTNGPFALSFLHLIRNYVLCNDDEDELFIYRIDRTKGGNSDGTKILPLSVAYLSNTERRRDAQGITSNAR
uniref:C2 DOCK-type domain-containing protein n=1 Tax=Meloidogyne javanica TaxID=6303 RepID=A0A915M1U0_MELJA